MAKEWKGEPVYPMMPDILQRKYLLKLLEDHVASLEAKCEKRNQPEMHRELCSLRPLLESLTNNEGELKAAMTILFDNYHNKVRSKDIKYGIFKVSDRKFCVVEKDDTSARNFTVNPELGPYVEGQMTGMVKFRRLTHNMNWGEAEMVYACLVLGKEVPEKYRRFLLADDD